MVIDAATGVTSRGQDLRALDPLESDNEHYSAPKQGNTEGSRVRAHGCGHNPTRHTARFSIGQIEFAVVAAVPPRGISPNASSFSASWKFHISYSCKFHRFQGNSVSHFAIFYLSRMFADLFMDIL